MPFQTTLLYPATSNATFDLSYYLNHHCKLLNGALHCEHCGRLLDALEVSLSCLPIHGCSILWLTSRIILPFCRLSRIEPGCIVHETTFPPFRPCVLIKTSNLSYYLAWPFPQAQSHTSILRIPHSPTSGEILDVFQHARLEGHRAESQC